MSWDGVLQKIRDILNNSAPSAIPALILGSLGLCVASSYRIIRDIIRPYFSPLRALKGPPGGTFVFGHMRAIQIDRAPGTWHQEQFDKYGPVLVYKAWLNTDRLMTKDTKALQHILSNSMRYQKPQELRYTLGRLLGKGLLFVEGHDHKRQRRIMNPAFGVLHLRDMTEIFVAKSIELRDALSSLANRQAAKDGWTPVDILAYLSCTTLDIIGLAGFNYSFDSIQHLLDDKQAETELSYAFSRIMSSTSRPKMISFLKMFFPPFRIITWDSRTRILRQAERTVREIGLRLVAEKKAALQTSQDKAKAKDLLTLLIKANMSNDKEHADKSLSSEEVLNQIPTFLMAGHETTSTATSWTLFSLATHPDIQDKLRQELLEVTTENPSMEELNALPYLERVVREALRYHSVVPGTVRVATEDDIIPLNAPFTDKYGKVHQAIRVKKGDSIMISIRTLNRDPDIWGPDAHEFNPDRWIDPPSKSAFIPGVWGNQLSFLGGSRSCIGFRFALIEMKALLYLLVRNFEFQLAVPADDVVGKLNIVTRPAVASQLEKGNQLPMLIRRIQDGRAGV